VAALHRDILAAGHNGIKQLLASRHAGTRLGPLTHTEAVHLAGTRTAIEGCLGRLDGAVAAVRGTGSRDVDVRVLQDLFAVTSDLHKECNNLKSLGLVLK
jgi:hypothetical protein